MSVRPLAALLVLGVAATPLAQLPGPEPGPIEVCPVLVGDRAPPVTYDRAGCQRSFLHQVDPQGRQLWVRLPANRAPADGTHFVGLLIAAKAASEVWLDGEPIGRNGVPGADRASEVPGRMDVVVPIPAQQLRAHGNRIDLRLSSHHGWLDLHSPVHAIEWVDFADPQAQALRYYLPSLLPLGMFLLAAFYFGSLTLRSERKLETTLLALMAILAGLQLLLEVARAWFAYAYPVHDLRLIGILACAAGFGLCLVVVHARRFAPRWLWPATVSAAGLSAIAIASSTGFDSKTSGALLVATAISLLLAAVGVHRNRPAARWHFVALALFGLANLTAPSLFIDTGFYLLVAALLVVLMILQGAAYGMERRLRDEQWQRADRLQRALDEIQAESAPKTLRVIGVGKLKQIPVDRIVRIQGADDYSELHLDDGSRILHTGTLSDLEAELSPRFLRVHRSHLVSMRCIERLDRTDAGTGLLHLRGSEPVPVSRRVMPGVRRALQ